MGAAGGTAGVEVENALNGASPQPIALWNPYLRTGREAMPQLSTTLGFTCTLEPSARLSIRHSVLLMCMLQRGEREAMGRPRSLMCAERSARGTCAALVRRCASR